jgi:micrococcal nuclease
VLVELLEAASSVEISGNTLKGGITVKKSIFVLFILMLFLTSFACAQNYTGKVLSVTNSDNISVVCGSNAATVRLNCAVCPAAGQPFAPEAQKMLEGLILNQSVEVRVVWTDHDNRQVARLLVNGNSVAVQLAGAGMAWYDKRFQQDGQILQAQATAQGKKIGIWSQPDPVAPWDFLTAQRGIRVNTSGPPTSIGSSSYGQQAASWGGDAGTSWDNNAQPLSTSAYGYGGGYGYGNGGMGPVARGAAVNAASNRGAISRGGGRR